MKCTEGPRAPLLPWPCSHIWTKMRPACGKDFRAWRPPIMLCILKRSDVTGSMNGKKRGVSVGGQKNVPHSIHGRDMASATNSVRSVRLLTINLQCISNWTCTHAGTHAHVCPFQSVFKWVVAHVLLFECVITMCVCASVFIFHYLCACEWGVYLCDPVCVACCGVGICVCDCSTICLSWFGVDAVQGAQLL